MNNKPQKTIAVLNQNARIGKTIISVNLAHSFINSGHKVLLVDSDSKGTARDWNEAADGKYIPVVGIDRSTLYSDIKNISSGYDIVIIDGHSNDERITASAIKAADFVLIPIRTSLEDLMDTYDLMRLIQDRKALGESLDTAIIISNHRLDLYSNETLILEFQLKNINVNVNILESSIQNRVIYQDAINSGNTVYTIERRQADIARCEIDFLKEEISSIIFQD